MSIYSIEERQFIRDYAKGHSRNEITVAVNKKFKKDFSVTQINNFLRHNHIRTGYKAGVSFSDSEKAFIEQYAPGHSRKEILEAFSEKFEREDIELSHIISFLKNHKISTGHSGRLTKGHSLNQLPVGTETIWKQGDYQYYGIKIAEPSVWKHKHIYRWEMEHGPIPDGMMLIFLDGNTLNPSLDNLMLISKRINVIMNKKKLPRGSREETLASISLARLIAGIRDVEQHGEVFLEKL